MNEFERRIRVRLGMEKGKKDTSVLGYEKMEKSCGVNPNKLKNSVLTTNFNEGKEGDEHE